MSKLVEVDVENKDLKSTQVCKGICGRGVAYCYQLIGGRFEITKCIFATNSKAFMTLHIGAMLQNKTSYMGYLPEFHSLERFGPVRMAISLTRVMQT